MTIPDITFDNDTKLMNVFMRSDNPNIKGVRKKAQDWLKEKGLYGALCWHEYTQPAPQGGTIVTLHVTHYLLALGWEA